LTVSKGAQRPVDFWRVNGYGYPCGFISSKNAIEAWKTLLTFFDFEDYEALKKFWESGKAPRLLNPHGVESWKAAFEEFGLLYVLSGTNKIVITPAGQQFKDAGISGDQKKFAWIGLNLLLRYPLRGPRRPKSPNHKDSDLLLYRFLYTAMLDLGGYFWWAELERILCTVFSTAEAPGAIEDVLQVRKDSSLLLKFGLPAAERRGALYNSLNQVVVHAGMNHFLIGVEEIEGPYGNTESKRKHFIREDWRGLIRRALSLAEVTVQCSTGGSMIARLPKAPVLESEQAYFDYLGARVADLDERREKLPLEIEFQGEAVLVLSETTHYEMQNENKILGPLSVLCKVARGQRLILAHDEKWTYIVEDKELLSGSSVKVTVRKARPITDIVALRDITGGNGA
jgi:hypothetical protein